MKPVPRYDLQEVITLVGTGRYRTTSAAQRDAGALGFDEDDIVECVCGLTAGRFYKSMESEKKPGLWQDVYRSPHGGHLLYVKLQVIQQADGKLAVVISFKEK